MREFIVKAASNKHYSVWQEETEIGNLVCEKWFSFKAVMSIRNKGTFQVIPKGFWGSTIEVWKDDKLVLNFKMHWNGQIIIKTWFAGVEDAFIFKNKGIFKSGYILQNKEGKELLEITPDFSWKKLHCNYIIHTSGMPDNEFGDLLMITSVHCANYFMAMATTAVIV